MRYRNIRRRDTGQWLRALFISAGDSFSVSPDSHIASMAAALALDPDELEAIDSDSDARTGTLISQPTVTITPNRKEELVAIGKDNWTDAQQKELIELLALRG